MNIIITGPKHCGKSTVIKKIISSYSGSISGFITEFDNRASEHRQLLLRNISGTESHCAARWSDESYELFTDAFDKYAPLLIRPGSDLIIIDELGKFEKDCSQLKNAVINAFDSECNVVVSIRLDAAGWMQQLKSRSDVTVFSVSENSRNNLPEEILKMLQNYSHIQ